MKRTGKIIGGSFILLMLVRFMELLFIQTDQTWLGENILHKLCCILLIAVGLALLGKKWSDLGFRLQGLLKGMKWGLLLGIITFALSYLVEFMVLLASGKHPMLQFYVTNFSLSATKVTGSTLLAVFVCVLGNVVNVWAEEGLFRGFYYQIGIRTFTDKTANLIQAILFGLWHISNVVIPVLDGTMSVGMAILMGIGYVVLAAVLAYEWGICAALTGTLWTGVFEHFFNNFVSNALHTVTETGADEMMVVRIALSNILSLTFVLLARSYYVRKKQMGGEQNGTDNSVSR